MPQPLIADKYRGLSFGEASEKVMKKYEDRFDPISKRGMDAELTSLRIAQEQLKAKEVLKQQIEESLIAAQQMQTTPQTTSQVVAPQVASNAGVSVNPVEDQTAFNHAASQSYNEQFAYGGTMDYFGGGLFDNITTAQSSGMESFQPITAPARPLPAMNIQVPQSVQKAGIMQSQVNTQNSGVNEQINPLRYAPLLSNIYNIVATRKPKSTASTLAGMGVRTQIDESLANRVQPRQTQFNNIDFSSLERGITNQARGFTGTNMNVSGGNAGQFVANELANQGNIMNAIAQARLAQQQGTQQTAQLNAAEQARIDAIRQAQAQMQAEIQGQNVQVGMNLANMDAANLGAYNNMKNANINALFENIGSIGRESDLMKSVAAGTGYDMFGQYFADGAPSGMMPWLQNILKAKKKK